MKYNEDTIYGFAGSVLAKNFDSPVSSPLFHREMWKMCLSDHKYVAIAAPRGHAKSTAITHTFTLFSILFRTDDYVLIISDTEGQAKEFLHNIATELSENEELRHLFKVKKFLRETATDVICEMEDGHKFRLVARGSEQKLRGLLWRGKRPSLVIGDDLENEELTANEDRREKFRRWFFGAVVPLVRRTGKIRIVGTVLHFDSLLERLLNNKSWHSKRFRAHNDDFSQILWPEMKSKEDLLALRQMYVDEGFPEGYAQEYLNEPIDASTAFIRMADLREATDEHLYQPGDYIIGVDLAISQAKRAARTAIVTVKVNEKRELIVVDVLKGRWDSKTIISELFNSVRRCGESLRTVIMERDKVEKALGPFIRDEMAKQALFFNISSVVPSGDKLQRARPLQAMLRSGYVYFDKNAEWYPDLETELLRFPKGQYRDQVDALSWIGHEINKIYESPTLSELAEEEYEEMLDETDFNFFGMDTTTGY